MNRFYGCLIFCCLGLGGCVNLRSVNVFSTATVGSLKQRATLPVSFAGIYRQRVQDDSLNRHPFGRILVVGIDFADRVRQDSLRSYQLADSLTKAGTTLLINYFDALANLSATGKAFVPVGLTSPSFSQFLQTSAVKLTPDQAASFLRVGNLLGSAATGAYRRRKLSALLEQSHTDVGQILAVLVFSNERLAEVVDISRDQQYGYYKTILIQDRTLTYAQTRSLAGEWLQTARAIDQTRQAVLTHVKTLKTIGKGFDQLYENRAELNRETVLADLSNYAATLQQLRTDLDQLKPVYGRFYP